MRTLKTIVALSTFVLSSLAYSAPVGAGEAGHKHDDHEHSVKRDSPAGWGDMSMPRFYVNPSEETKIGDFPGRLVCLRCDLAAKPGAMKQCAEAGHRHALSMDEGAMIHPLLAGTGEALKQINSEELHNKNVKVHGRYYQSTGAILVDRVSLAE